ncbi:hypothetical protein [Nonomuraea sp. NPDC005501]|uniref:calcium-binding protein n=1 Tax=Nonomuraea sp. NPDC005501 TaxID=3156884 RepID=UPI0033B8B7BD
MTTVSLKKRSWSATRIGGMALAVGLVTTAFTTAFTTPAHALADVITVHVNGRTVFITGTPGKDVINITNLAGKVSVGVDTSVTAGAGCAVKGPQVVDCTGTGSGILFIEASTIGGDDSVNNQTSLQSSMLGGSGVDRLTGGSGRDGLNGGSGDDILKGGGDIDTANGAAGTDTCTAETESNCEV